MANKTQKKMINKLFKKTQEELTESKIEIRNCDK